MVSHVEVAANGDPRCNGDSTLLYCRDYYYYLKKKKKNRSNGDDDLSRSTRIHLNHAGSMLLRTVTGRGLCDELHQNPISRSLFHPQILTQVLRNYSNEYAFLSTLEPSLYLIPSENTYTPAPEDERTNVPSILYERD